MQILKSSKGSRGVFCGRSKLWAQVIAWLHTILNGLALLLLIGACVLFFGFEYWTPTIEEIAKFEATHYSVIKGHHYDPDPDPQTARKNYMCSIAIWFALCMAEYLTGTVVGVILIIGVRQSCPTKILIWMLTVAITLILSTLLVMYTVMATGWNETAPRMIILLFNYICIWPVNAHRKELVEAEQEENEDYHKSSRR